MREAVVVGSGAREHALVKSLKQGGVKVWATPGNDGIAQDASILPLQKPQELANVFLSHKPLVVIGPEAHLAKGWADVLRHEGFPVVGPSKAAARLESSKRFAKDIMQRLRIPTARVRVASTSQQLADWIRVEDIWPKVLKQSGLAQGKGVHIVNNREEALAQVQKWYSHEKIWKDGVLFEDYLEGYEVSVQVLTNGRHYVWLPLSRDYKRLAPDPGSPNTGGMGAVTPVVLDSSMVDRISRQVLDPLMEYVAQSGWAYRGVLYVGLMITRDGPLVLEFNVRLGDPEAQAIIPALDIDWYDLWMSLSQGELPRATFVQKAAVAVVLAASGYPNQPQTGMTIELGHDMDDTLIYHAGTACVDGVWESRGGRVLTVVGMGNSVEKAQHLAYERLANIKFPHSYHRLDIGNPLSSDEG